MILGMVIFMTVLEMDSIALPKWSSKILTLFPQGLATHFLTRQSNVLLLPCIFLWQQPPCQKESHCWSKNKIRSSQLVTVALCTARFLSLLQLMTCFQPRTVPPKCASNLEVLQGGCILPASLQRNGVVSHASEYQKTPRMRSKGGWERWL